MTEQLALGLIVVRCLACPHVVERATPDDAHDAHDAMEVHYAEQHATLIARLIGDV